MTAKHTLIALAMISLGILLALIGYFSGGRWLIIKDEDGFHVPSKQQLASQSYTLDAFTNIDIRNDYGDVEIIAAGSDYKLEIKALEEQDITYQIDNDTLFIETATKNKNRIEFGSGSWHSPSIKIYVPADNELSTLTINNNFGDIAIHQLHYQQLDLQQDYGDIMFEQTAGEKTTINQSFGDITFQQAINNGLTIDSEHGDIDMNGTLYGSSTITSSFGDTTLHLQNSKDDIGFDLTTSFGDITINDKEQGNTVSQVYNGEHQLTISSSNGDIDLSLK
ncbi:DUF4097 family beta strand repeat-containing protein [Lysinibacillus sp. NPDC098008]|uniref:DUF4097 family beta strand repeat-containing protein n=1 Tax=Lysinibacillus sp. NPDC098008 TaxID=3364146 RepID=UPI00380C3B61